MIFEGSADRQDKGFLASLIIQPVSAFKSAPREKVPKTQLLNTVVPLTGDTKSGTRSPWFQWRYSSDISTT